ncbi:MAG: membrane dipeptidase [Roseburia sp.]|nr:membrane dipeptidase [Roseburia sp.]
MKYIDMHCDTLSAALGMGSKTAEHLEGTMVDTARLRGAGAAAQFFAMFLCQGNQTEESESDKVSRLEERMEKMYEIFRNTLSACENYLAPAGNFAQMEENSRNGKISAFLTIENGYLVRGDMANLKRFYDMGVRLITLTWNDANCFGVPHSAKISQMQQGLTDFGKEAVRYMQKLGIVVDVSHLSDGGFYDVAEAARKTGTPFVASHSNCRALCPATRNLTDEMIRTLADCGGVAGINFEPSFLNTDMDDKISRVERMCDHICHFIDKGGADCVGIGTDFDGIGGQFEISDCTKMPLLFDALHRRGLSDDLIEKIAYGNVAQVIREAMK